MSFVIAAPEALAAAASNLASPQARDTLDAWLRCRRWCLR